jgi:hypothetical protein
LGVPRVVRLVALRVGAEEAAQILTEGAPRSIEAHVPRVRIV